MLTADGVTVEAGTLLWDTADVAPAFDLTIDEIHTYHVTAGDGEVLVHNNNLRDCLSDAQEEALLQYTTELDEPVNTALRTGHTAELTRLEVEIYLIDEALDALPTFEGTVFRGMPLENLPEGFPEEFVEGADFSDPGFLSANSETPFSGEFQFEIESKTGVVISELSGIGNESEILFPSETQFRIESVTPTADGEATLIVLTEL